MNQVITGVPFGDGTVHSYLDTSSGELVVDLGALPDAEATVTTDYQTARKIFLEQDPTFVLQAFMTGRIKVRGDTLRLISLRTAIPQDDIGKEVVQEIRSITEM